MNDPDRRAGGWRAAARDVLSRHFLLGEIGPEVLDDLLAYAIHLTPQAGEALFVKGDPGTSLMAVLKGTVRISTVSADGKEVVLNLLGPGQVFGEIALLDGAPRTADATAHVATELAVIERRHFLPFLERNPAVAARMIAVLCERLRWVSDMVEDVVFLDLPSRLAKRLLRLADDFGQPVREGLRIDLRLSQQDLGAFSGATREAVNKILRGWEEQGIVELRRNEVVVLRRDDLELMTEFL